MKFANYYYKGKNINNLGDHVQILTVDYLYRDMGVNADDIVYINKDDLEAYNGDPVLLPVSMPLIDYKENGLAGMFSPKITPIFFGLTMAKDELLPREVDYLKEYEPVGCRDERTYNTLTGYGVSSYLGGCLTVTLPGRKFCPEKHYKVYVIDPTGKVKEHIPEDIAENAVWGTHLFYTPMENPKDVARNRYLEYQNEARLVITSLLHCSVPCMAMGIPVILAKDVVSYRFAWLEALLKIYTPQEYNCIDWDPSPIVYNSHKALIKSLFNKRMMGQDASSDMSQTHAFYMNRERCKYVVDAFISIQNFIDTTWLDREKAYNYAVWGLTQMADMTVSYIAKRYPNAKLTHVYDLQAGLKFHGNTAIHPNNITSHRDETVFVTTVGAAKSAKQFFCEINKPQHLYNILEVVI